MTRYLSAYASTLVVMVAIDLLWLGVIAKPLYQRGIGHLMADHANLPVAVLFYLLYPLGLVYFGVAPNASEAGLKAAFCAGAAIGFFAYATYDLTNLATLRDWPARLALIDVVWGAFLSGISATAGKAAFDWFGRSS